MCSIVLKRSELVYCGMSSKITRAMFLNDMHFVTIVKRRGLQIHNFKSEECVYELQADNIRLQGMSYSHSFSVVSLSQVGESN